MAQVNVTINGKNYRMACDEGQEEHLLSLGQRLDAHVMQLKGAFGEIGDQRLTVMAGVMVADELVELERKVKKLEAEIEQIKSNSESAAGELSSSEEQAAEQINAIADKLNGIVGKLTGKDAAE